LIQRFFLLQDLVTFVFTGYIIIIMFRSLFQFLNRDLTNQIWSQKSYHPYFGNMLLFAFKNSDKSYWETEIDFESHRLSVSIDSPDLTEPSKPQIDFARQIIAGPDVALSRALPLLAPEFERWHNKPLPADWRAALKLMGFTVPVNGNDNNEWELSFESLWDAEGHLFTCTFIDGEPKTISVDG